MSSLTLRAVGKRYAPDVVALHDVDLEIDNHEFVSVVGPSGCGKTSLLRVIAGLEEDYHGSVLFDGRAMENVAPRHRNVAMVFQDDALYPHFSVFDNIAFPLKMAKVSRPELRQRVNETAKQFSIDNLLDRRPHTLSGGQRQRVALGRAMVRRPDVLLLDEPFSNLDAHLRRELRNEIRKTRATHPVTTVFVTHDQREALSLGDRVVVMDQGQVVQFDAPAELLATPVNRTVGALVGDPPMNFFAGRMIDGRFESAVFRFQLSEGQLKWGDQKARDVMLGLRPSAIEVGPVPEGDADVALQGKVKFAEKIAGHWETNLILGDGTEFIVQSSEPVTDASPLFFGKQKVHLFEMEDGRNLLAGSS